MIEVCHHTYQLPKRSICLWQIRYVCGTLSGLGYE